MVNQERTPDEALESALEADAQETFGDLVRKAHDELTPQEWQVWYFIVGITGTARERLRRGRIELRKTKEWSEARKLNRKWT